MLEDLAAETGGQNHSRLPGKKGEQMGSPFHDFIDILALFRKQTRFDMALSSGVSRRMFRMVST